MRSRYGNDGDSVGAAVAEVFQAGQQLLVDRIDLAREEMRQAARDSSTIAAYVVGGLVFGLIGWIAVMAVVAIALSFVAPVAVGVSVVALINLGLAGWLLASARRRLKDKQPPVDRQPPLRSLPQPTDAGSELHTGSTAESDDVKYGGQQHL